jgi:hypothetical protein
MHTYIKTFVITYTSIQTYGANRTRIYAYIQKPITSVVPCWGACFNLKKSSVLYTLEKDSLFLDTKHVATQNGKHVATHKHINSDTDTVTYICTLYYIHTYVHTCIQCKLTYIPKNIHTYIHTYMNMYTIGKDFQYHRRNINPLFPREMRSGSSN